MSVLKKLMEARISLNQNDLKKSGLNKFAGYSYFELGDFLPATMTIFHKLQLASVVSFTEDLASLTITDTEDNSAVTITSPMAEANLKGTHPIQNLGAVQSYQRRYLWLAAMEIVEHDAIDSAEPVKDREPVKAQEPKPAAKPAAKAAPTKIVGKDGQWQIKVSITPDSEDWLELVDQAVSTTLTMAESADDVLQIFKKNKQLFDAIKAHDPVHFKAMMEDFSNTKAQFAG
jgi:hypothetical protein